MRWIYLSYGLAGLVLAAVGALAGVNYGRQVRDPYLAGDYGDHDDWHLDVLLPTTGRLEFPQDEGHGIRVVLDRADPENAWCAVLSFPVMPLVQGERYRLSFHARSPRPRSMLCKIQVPRGDHQPATEPETVDTGPNGRAYEISFVSKLTHDKLAIHFFVGQSEVPVEVSHLSLEKIDPTPKPLADSAGLSPAQPGAASQPAGSPSATSVANPPQVTQ